MEQILESVLNAVQFHKIYNVIFLIMVYKNVYFFFFWLSHALCILNAIHRYSQSWLHVLLPAWVSTAEAEERGVV